jgi:ABC-type dipeptide/oligopeptide/nickel transport system permease subunit
MISEGTPHLVSGQGWKSLFPDAVFILMTAGFILIGEGINAGAERSSM